METKIRPRRTTWVFPGTPECQVYQRRSSTQQNQNSTKTAWEHCDFKQCFVTSFTRTHD